MRTPEELDAAVTAIQGQLDVVVVALKGQTILPAIPLAPSGNPDLDPRWYTPMTDAEKKAFAAANSLNADSGGDASGGETAMNRARYGWTDKGTVISLVTTAEAFAANAKIAAGPPYVGQELDCYLNLTNRKGTNPNDDTTVDGWVNFNNRQGSYRPGLTGQ